MAEPGTLTGPAAGEGASAGREVPGWLSWISTGLTLAGLGVAGYLTAAHYTTPALLACPDRGVVDCARVTTSPQSVLLGVPVAVWGLLFFAGLLPLLTPAAWRSAARWIFWTRLTSAGAGVAMVVYLVYTELFTLGAICLYCTAVHVITLLLFLVVAVGSALAAPGPG